MSVAERENKTRADRTSHFDAIVVGAGLAGLYMLHRQRALGK
jgi:cation diffusion facilitator CzcD-associated flavoprotein CzcO